MFSFRLSPRLQRLVTGVPFRLFVAAAMLALHVSTTISFARERWPGAVFNNAPDHAPLFHDVLHDTDPMYAKRLLVSRWDAGIYLRLSMRGYRACPDRTLTKEEMGGPGCSAAFYPGYPALGWALTRVTGLAPDYALWAISLAASLLLLFLWTDRVIVDALGIWGAYASLLAFNFFPTASYLVFIMTEPCILAFTMAAFVALGRKHYALAVLAAGSAGAIRITGIAVEAACGLALLVSMWVDRPRSPWRWVGRIALLPIATWGSLVVSGYDGWRFHDPLLYVHAHAAAYSHESGFDKLLHSEPAWFIHGIDNPGHDLVWAGALLLFFAFGHRVALRRFPGPVQVYAYGVVVLTYVVTGVGSMDLRFLGFGRYVLVAIPAFFAMGAIFKRRPIIFAAWLFVTTWHAREVDLCYFLGDVGAEGLRRCNVAQWVGN
jgi:hypothetical protein